MKKIVKFETSEGSGEYIEIEVQGDEPGTIASRGGGAVAEKAEQSFDAALAKIRPVANAVFSQVQALAKKPDSVAVEFGIKFSAKAGIVIASADTEANLKVTLTWKSG